MAANKIQGSAWIERLLQLAAYLNTRDDTGTEAPTNFLYTLSNGNLASAPLTALPGPTIDGLANGNEPATPTDGHSYAFSYDSASEEYTLVDSPLFSGLTSTDDVVIDGTAGNVELIVSGGANIDVQDNGQINASIGTVVDPSITVGDTIDTGINGPAPAIMQGIAGGAVVWTARVNRFDIEQDVLLSLYPETRDDNSSPINFLSTDATGNLRSNPIEDIGSVLSINDLSDVTFTGSTLGAILVTDENGNLVEYDDVLFGQSTSNCIFSTENELGQDWCNWQAGNNGSAFYIAKKSNGTIAAPTPLTDGQKIGGMGFIAEDGQPIPAGPAGSPGYVGGEVVGYAVGAQSATNGGTEVRVVTTPEGTKASQMHTTFLDDGTVQFNQYPAGNLITLADGTVVVAERFSAQLAAPTGNNGTTLLTALNLNVDIAAAGTYKLSVRFISSVNTGAEDLIVAVLQDGVTTLTTYQVEHKDSGGAGLAGVINLAGGTFNSGTNQRVLYSDELLVNFGAAGTHNIDLQIAGSLAGIEPTLYEASLILERWL